MLIALWATFSSTVAKGLLSPAPTPLTLHHAGVVAWHQTEVALNPRFVEHGFIKEFQ